MTYEQVVRRTNVVTREKWESNDIRVLPQSEYTSAKQMLAGVIPLMYRGMRLGHII